MKNWMHWILTGLMGFFMIFPVMAQEGNEEPLVALFVQNRAGTPLEAKIDMFGDLLAANLSMAGFRVSRQEDILMRFSKSPESTSSEDIRNTVEWLRALKSEGSADEASSSASALQLGKLLQADFVVMASLLSEGVNRMAYQGYGMTQNTDMHVLRVAVRILDVVQGASLYGDTIVVTEQLIQNENMHMQSSDIVNALLERAAGQIAAKAGGSAKQIAERAPHKIPTADVTITSNVRGATVEVDGVAIGSTPGTFELSPGLHQVRVSKEWYSTWERTINVRGDNQMLDIPMELTAAGLARKDELEEQARRDDILREQSSAQAEATRATAGGAAAQMSNSYIRLEGMPDSLQMGNDGGSDHINVIQTGP